MSPLGVLAVLYSRQATDTVGEADGRPSRRHPDAVLYAIPTTDYGRYLGGTA